MTEILKGKPIADMNMDYCVTMIQRYDLSPHLYVFLIGADSASEYYINSIKKQGEKFNINVTINSFTSEEMSEELLLDSISSLNKDNSVHGIIVQKPLPRGIDAKKVDFMISPDKDVDGFHALNAGFLLQEKACFLPCTAQSILEIMDYYYISAAQQHVVVVGRSNVVGKPIANLLLYKEKNRNATVTITHSQTKDLSHFTKQADILITAVGVPNLIKSEMIKEGVIILDAGINKLISTENKVSFVGDVDFASCFPKCKFITPVPGGVGSVTTSVLFKHLCDAAKNIENK